MRVDKPADAARRPLQKGTRRVSEKVAEIKMGDPMDPKSQMGPMNSKRHMERVNMMIKSGVDDGAKLMIGGKRPAGKNFERGFWIERPCSATCIRR